MIGQPVSSFDFREAMDSKKILIINLSKGRIGDENMKLLGGLLVTKIYLAAMSRADVPDRVLKTLPNFYLFVDEFQNFANASFADILSEARKYKLNLTIAHQYVEQVDEFVRPAVFGNVGTMIVFRVGATDAEFLEKEFVPQFEIEDLVNLGFAQIYLKLMIDGLTSSPFSGTTLPPIAHPDVSYVKEIVDSSRAQFAKPRAQVEEIILKFHDAAPKSASASKAFTGSGPSSSGQGLAGSYKPPVASPNSFSASKLPINTGSPVASGPTTPMASPTTTGQVTSPSPSAPKAVAPTTPSIPAVPRPATAMTPPSASPTPSSYNSPKPPVRPAAPAPTITPRPSPSQSPSQLRPQSQPPKPTPVSLSSLAQNTNQRQDPKIPSPENIGDLKSALAAALSKANAEKVQQGINKSKAAISDNRPVSQPVPQPKPQPQPVQQPKPATAQPPISSAKPILPTNQVPPAKPVVPLTPVPAPVLAPAPVSQPPLQPQPAAQLKPQSKEVPEDVLKDVLKMD